MRVGLPSTLIYAEHFHHKRIDLETLLEVDQNEDVYILYSCGWSKTVEMRQNENKDLNW